MTVAKMRRDRAQTAARTRCTPRPGLVHGAVRRRPTASRRPHHPGRSRSGGAVLDHDTARHHCPRRTGRDPGDPRPRWAARPSERGRPHRQSPVLDSAVRHQWPSRAPCADNDRCKAWSSSTAQILHGIAMELAFPAQKCHGGIVVQCLSWRNAPWSPKYLSTIWTAVPESAPINFTWDGVDYEIELNKKNAVAFEKAVKPYVEAARRSRGGRGRRSSSRSSGKRDLGAIRDWAAQNGFERVCARADRLVGDRRLRGSQPLDGSQPYLRRYRGASGEDAAAGLGFAGACLSPA